jgi:predicted RND superfamily exporter protein
MHVRVPRIPPLLTRRLQRWLPALRRRFAVSIASHPLWWWMVVLGFSAAALVGISRLTFDDDPRAIAMGDDQASAQLRRFYERFGADDQDVLLVVRAADVFEPVVMNAARDLAIAAAEVDGVARVHSIFGVRRRGRRLVPLIPRRGAEASRYAHAKALAATHPLAAGQLVSADATTLLLIARLAGDPESIANLAVPVAGLRQLAHDASRQPGLEVTITGHPVIRVDILSALMRDLATFAAASCGVALLVAGLVFRRWAAVFVVVLAPAVGVLWIVGLMPLFGLTLNGVNAVLPTLVYVIGVTDAIHLVIDFRVSRAADRSRRCAVREVVNNLAFPCLLTSLTTAIGFGSLSLAHDPLIRSFGLVCGTGTMVNFVAVITVVPLLLSTRLGDHIMPREGAGRAGQHWIDLNPVLRLVEAAPRRIVVVAIASGIMMAVVSTRLRPDFLVTETIPNTSESAVALDLLDEAFGGGMVGYVVMEWPEDLALGSPEVLHVLEQVHHSIEVQPEFRASFSVRNLLSAMSSDDQPEWESVERLRDVPSDELGRLVRLDDHQLVVSFRITNAGAARLAPAFEKLQCRLEEQLRSADGFSFYVTGTLPVVARGLWSMIDDLARSLTASAVLVFIVIGVALGSWKLGVMSIVPNVLPLLATSTLLVMCGEPLRIISVVTYSLCLGIAVDDTIHFLVRFQRENGNGSAAQAVRQAMRTAGHGIVTSTVILVGGFSVMLLSRMPSIRWLALLCDVAMLAAIVAVLVILPALLLCFWPQKPTHEELGERVSAGGARAGA